MVRNGFWLWYEIAILWYEIMVNYGTKWLVSIVNIYEEKNNIYIVNELY